MLAVNIGDLVTFIDGRSKEPAGKVIDHLG